MCFQYVSYLETGRLHNLWSHKLHDKPNLNLKGITLRIRNIWVFNAKARNSALSSNLDKICSIVSLIIL